MGSIRSPSASSGVPAARYPAAGAKMSRPAKVAPGASSWYSGLVSDTTRAAPPSMATAGARRPLSGPTRNPVSTSTATARRSVPTPGSTTARTTPGGRYWIERASARAPARTSKGGMPWVTSMIWAAGAARRTTALQTPTNSSARP